jgi:hypothetical protein
MRKKLITANNVIQFPSNRSQRVVKPSDSEALHDKLVNVKVDHIIDTIETVVPILFNNLNTAGFDFDDENSEKDPFVKDGSMVVETLKSMMCKYYGISHPLQKLAEKTFDETNDGTIELSKRVNVSLSTRK